MGQLVMSFRGLWTHVNPNPGTPESWSIDNVSAVNASNGASYSPEGFVLVQLPAHVFYIEATETVAAFLTSAGLPVSEDLGAGWTVSVQNATGALNVNVTGVPSLRTYDPDMQLNPDEDWACVVGISHGLVTAGQFQRQGDNPGGGLYTTWTVQTEEKILTPPIGVDLPLDAPILVFTPPNNLPPVTVRIPSTPIGAELGDHVPGSLVLHNSAAPTVFDTPFDFALYYLAAVGGIPATFASPLPGTELMLPMPQLEGLSTTQIRNWIVRMEVWLIEIAAFGVFLDMGTSCSNSQYP